MSPQAAELPRIARPEVEHLDDYVLGYPMHVAITIHLRPDDPSSEVYGAFRSPACSRSPGVEAKFATEDDPLFGKTLAPQWLAVLVPCPLGETTSSSRVSGGECWWTYPNLELAGLKPGKYTVTVTYGGESARPFDVTLHAPSPAQRAELAQLEGERDEAGTWGQWAMYPALGKPHPYTALVNASDPLRFNKVLYYLFHTRHAIPPSSVQGLTGIYGGSASVLEAELMLLGGDQKGYADFAAKLRASHPETNYALDALDHGESLIATMRQNTEDMEKGLK